MHLRTTATFEPHTLKRAILVQQKVFQSTQDVQSDQGHEYTYQHRVNIKKLFRCRIVRNEPVWQAQSKKLYTVVTE